MEFERTRSEDLEVLKLEGRCTIEQANDLKALLIETLESGNGLMLDVERVSEIDITCLQLFCAAHRAFLKSNRKLSLNDNLPECFRRMVRQAGFSRAVSCHGESDASCLWKGR